MSSIGNILRKERDRQKLQLSDVSEETKINIRYLKALETDNYSVFPAAVYVIGFIKNYARFLGIDANELISQYKGARPVSADILVKAPPKKDLQSPPPQIQRQAVQPPKQPAVPKVSPVEKAPGENTKIGGFQIPNIKININWDKLKQINMLPFLVGLGVIVLIILITVIAKSIKPSSDDNRTVQFAEMKLLQFEEDNFTYDLNFNEYYKVLLGRNYHSMMVEKVAAEKEENPVDTSGVICHFDKSIVQLSTISPKSIDFDLDGILDLELKLNSVSLDKFNMTIRQLHAFSTNTNTSSATASSTNRGARMSDGFKSAEKGKIVFTALVKEKNYIQVWLDGKEEEPKIYYPGNKIRFEANDVIQLKIAKAGGLAVEINGRPQKLGRLGVANKIIKWERDPNDETMYNLVIKDWQ